MVARAKRAGHDTGDRDHDERTGGTAKGEIYTPESDTAIANVGIRVGTTKKVEADTGMPMGGHPETHTGAQPARPTMAAG